MTNRDEILRQDAEDLARLGYAQQLFREMGEIWQHVLIGTGAFSASDNGVLASRGRAGPARLAWVDRAGRETGSLASPAGFESVRLSPDSRGVVVSRDDPRTGTHDLLVGELPRDVLTRLNLGSEDHLAPTWSPDGTRIAFTVASTSHGPNLTWLALHGSVSPEPIIPAGATQRPTDWSSDGRFLLYTLRSGSDSGLWVVNLEGERKSRKLLSVSAEAIPQIRPSFLPTAAGLRTARLSPTGPRSLSRLFRSRESAFACRRPADRFPAGSGTGASSISFLRATR